MLCLFSREEDDVRSFRELLRERGMQVPWRQSSLSVPTESEVRLGAAASN